MANQEPTVQEAPLEEAAHREPVTVTVNTKPVKLPSHRVTGLEIKKEAIAQGVDIQLDFQLVEEAHDDHPAHDISDDTKITVNKHSKFTANDVDDDS